MFRNSSDSFKDLCSEVKKNYYIDPSNNERYGVKRGLRNNDNTGVLAGLTGICNVHGYVINEGEKTPDEGKLTYRGIDVRDIIDGCRRDNRFGFEEVVYLLIFGSLPDAARLEQFRGILAENRDLPMNFAEDMILKAPSPNIMNKLARNVLSMYSYDDNPDDLSVENLVRQAMILLAQVPTAMIYAYQIKRRQYDQKSMYFHPIDPSHWTAEYILSALRLDMKFTDAEAKLLDTCMILHAEHGGGNNSAFAARVLSSSGTDTYSAIAAAIGSLKGPRHGGANVKVRDMMECIKENVNDRNDDEEVAAFLKKIVRREAGDGSGLIYGMGHAVYTASDPRAVILKERCREAAAENGLLADFELLDTVERTAPRVLAEVKGVTATCCANVDLYSGLIYKTLHIPRELYTPLFAVSRLAGWCAHRIEEVVTGKRIIRPAYKSVVEGRKYTDLANR